MVELKNVDVHFKDGGGVDALNGVNLRIEDGEFVFIVGDSGAGKSTFLKLLTREIAPTSGRVFVNGYNLAKIKNKKIPYFRRSIGMIFQDPMTSLNPNMTVGDQIAEMIMIHEKIGKAQAMEKAEKMLEMSESSGLHPKPHLRNPAARRTVRRHTGGLSD